MSSSEYDGRKLIAMKTLITSTSKTPPRRLVLRPYSHESHDFESLLSIFQDDRVTKYIFLCRSYKKFEFQKFVKDYMARQPDDPIGVGTILDLERGEVLGCAGIT